MMRFASLINITVLSLALSAGAARADDLEVCHKAEGDDAIDACSRLIASGNLKGHDLVDVYTGRGMAREATGDFDGAIADYDQAIKLDPKDAFPYQVRSLVRREKGDIDGAIADYNRGIALNPKLLAASPAQSYALDLANDAFNKGDYASVMSIVRPLANQGSAGAQTFVGLMYETGRGGVSQDYTEAARWYRKAADQGQVQGQVQLSKMYYSGRGVPQNFAESSSGPARRPIKVTPRPSPTWGSCTL